MTTIETSKWLGTHTKRRKRYIKPTRKATLDEDGLEVKNVLLKARVRSKKNKRICIKRFMNVIVSNNVVIISIYLLQWKSKDVSVSIFIFVVLFNIEILKYR